MAYIGNYPAETQTVDLKWQPIKTASFIAVAGEGYRINTTSGAVTVTLPASANAGDTIEFSDYSRTWGTNSITINQNSLNFQGYTSPNPEYNTSGQSVRLVYSGATQGWIPTVDDDVTLETPPPYSVDFLVVAGGGGGGYAAGGGGGAGGYRNSYSTETSGGGGSSETELNFNIGTVYTITVGAGGAGDTNSGGTGTNGTNSSISGTGITTITSSGGGGGGSSDRVAGALGGSGGGGAFWGTSAGGSGTANQGFDGGNGSSATNFNDGGGGGGGSGGIGQNGTNGSGNSVGGIGLASSITASSITRAIGGNGGKNLASGNAVGSNASSNTGSGGEGGDYSTFAGGSGGSGVVILRIPTADYTGTTSGTPTVSTDGTDTILIYNASGSYTA